MALGPRLEIRQSQSLVMTPQLQQAIKLLALSNLEQETHIAEALEANPLLEMGEVSREAVEPVERPSEGEATPLMDSAGGEEAPLDVIGVHALYTYMSTFANTLGVALEDGASGFTQEERVLRNGRA